jgi:hypothetical protein
MQPVIDLSKKKKKKRAALSGNFNFFLGGLKRIKIKTARTVVFIFLRGIISRAEE